MTFGIPSREQVDEHSRRVYEAAMRQKPAAKPSKYQRVPDFAESVYFAPEPLPEKPPTDPLRKRRGLYTLLVIICTLAAVHWFWTPLIRGV